MTASQSSSVILKSRLSRVTPALLTSTSMRPSSSTTRATAACTDAASLTSQARPTAEEAPSPAAVAAAAPSSRSSTATAAPSSANRWAVAAPIPRGAPGDDGDPVGVAAHPVFLLGCPCSVGACGTGR